MTNVLARLAAMQADPFVHQRIARAAIKADQRRLQRVGRAWQERDIGNAADIEHRTALRGVAKGGTVKGRVESHRQARAATRERSA